MPDDLASLISGTDPLAPIELRAYQAIQNANAVRDASQWANQGPFGALARTIAGFGAPMQAQNALQQVAAAKAAANPQLFQALASGNPYQWGANNPQAGPVALSSILANAPAATKALYEGSAAGLNLQNLASLQALSKASNPTAPGLAPNAAVVNKAPVAAPAATPTQPDLTGVPSPAVSGVLPTQAAGLPNPMALATANPGVRAAALAQMSGAQRAQFLQVLRALAQPGTAGGAK